MARFKISAAVPCKGGIDRGPFGKISSSRIFVVDGWDVAPTTKEGLDISVLATILFRAFHVVLNPRISLKVGFDIGGCF